MSSWFSFKFHHCVCKLKLVAFLTLSSVVILINNNEIFWDPLSLSHELMPHPSSSSSSLTVYSTDGNRIAKSTGLDMLLQSDFDLKINDLKYRVQVPHEGGWGYVLSLSYHHSARIFC